MSELVLHLIGRSSKHMPSYVVISRAGKNQQILRAKFLTRHDVDYRRLPEILRRWSLGTTADDSEMTVVQNIMREGSLYEILYTQALPNCSVSYMVPYTLEIEKPEGAHLVPEDLPFTLGRVTSGPEELMGITFVGEDPEDVYQTVEKEAMKYVKDPDIGGSIRGWEDDLGE